MDRFRVENLKKLIFSATFKDTIWVFSGNVVSSFLAFIYTIFLARSLNPANYGIFAAVFSFMLLTADIGDLGIGSTLSRFLPPLYIQKKYEEASSFFKTAFIFQLKIALFLTVLIFSSAKIISGLILNDTSFSNLFRISAFGVLGIIILAFFSFYLSCQKKFLPVAFLSVMSTMIKAIIIFALFSFNLLNVKNALIAFMLSAFVVTIFLPIFLSFDFIKVREQRNNLKKLLSFSIFLGVSRFFSAASSRLDALMLIPLSSAYEAGIYAGAYKIAFLYIILLSSFSMVIAPRLSGMKKMEDSLNYLKKVVMAVILILLTMGVMFVISDWFVTFVLGVNYLGSVAVFKLLLVPMALFTLTVPTVNFLLYVLSKPHVSTFNTFVQLIIIFFGNLLFIPKFGRFGPVATLTVSYGFTFLSSLFFSVYYYRKKIYAE